jgi:hypothetical protein
MGVSIMKKTHAFFLFGVFGLALSLGVLSDSSAKDSKLNIVKDRLQRAGASAFGAGKSIASVVRNRFAKSGNMGALALIDTYEKAKCDRANLLIRDKLGKGDFLAIASDKELDVVISDLAKANENLGKVIKSNSDIDEMRRGMLYKIGRRVSGPAYKIVKGAINSVIDRLSPYASFVFMIAVLYHMNVLYVLENKEVFPFPMNIPIKAIVIALRVVAEMGIVPIEHLLAAYAKAQVACLVALLWHSTATVAPLVEKQSAPVLSKGLDLAVSLAQSIYY